MQAQRMCNSCNGSGGTQVQICTNCNGRGFFEGYEEITKDNYQNCPDCRGDGFIDDDRTDGVEFLSLHKTCRRCGGQGGYFIK